MKDKFKTCPPEYDSRMFFFSKEAQEQFDSADESVKKTAMAILEMTCKQSMKEIENDFIRKAFDEIFIRLERLEKK